MVQILRLIYSRKVQHKWNLPVRAVDPADQQQKEWLLKDEESFHFVSLRWHLIIAWRKVDK